MVKILNVSSFVLFTILFLSTSYACKEKKSNTVTPNTNQEIIPEEDIEGTKTNLLSSKIRSMLHDSKGFYWFGSDGDGVYRYDGKGYINFTYENGLGDNQIRSIDEDQKGNIWVGTGMGVSRFDGKKFTRITYDETDLSFKNTINPQWASKPGDLWFEASDKREGVYRFNGISLNLLQLPKNKMDGGFDANKTNIVSPYGVYYIYKDSKGYVWFGTQTLGVCCYTGNSFFWLSDKQLAGPAVRAIFEDSKGNLWFGNNGGGLYKYDGNALQNITELNGLGNIDFTKGKGLNDNPGTMARVWSINEDNLGDIWIATIDAGVWRYDGKTLVNYSVKDGLSIPVITLIFKDKKGELWFGSEGAGVFKFDGSKFYAFTR